MTIEADTAWVSAWLTLWLPAILTVTAIGSLAWRGAARAHRIATRLEKALPVLESLTGEFPGTALVEHLQSMEHAIDLQSQEIMRLAEVMGSRRLGGRRRGDPPYPQPGVRDDPARDDDPLRGWRPPGWPEGER